MRRWAATDIGWAINTVLRVTRRLRSILFIALVTIGITVYSVLDATQSMWARIVGGLFAGLFFSLSVLGYLRLTKRLGLITSAIVISLIWGAVFFLLALASPHCPGTVGTATISAGRCSVRGASSYLGIGLLTPVVFVVLLGPAVYAIRVWRRTSSYQHRHPTKSLLIAVKTWALRKSGRGPAPATAPKAKPSRLKGGMATGSSPSTAIGGTYAAANSPRDKPAKRTSRATKGSGRTESPGVVHNKRITSSPKHPKP